MPFRRYRQGPAAGSGNAACLASRFGPALLPERCAAAVRTERRRGGLVGPILAFVALVSCDAPAVGRQDASGEDRFVARRETMVKTQLEARGIRDARVLEAMRLVPRHRFVPPELAEEAYGDHPLPIGEGQTISQPYIVAYMTEALALEPSDKVLEIGTGSGYQAAVLARLVEKVYTIEIVPELAARAAETLEALGFDNVIVRTGDGHQGWPEEAPFDAIMVTAAPETIPPRLVDQLALGGRLIAPVGVSWQELVLVTKTATGVVERTLIPVRFVPMTGKPVGHP